MRAGPHKVVVCGKDCEPKVLDTKEYLKNVPHIPEETSSFFPFDSVIPENGDFKEEIPEDDLNPTMDLDNVDIEGIKKELLDETDGNNDKKSIVKNKYIPKNAGVLTSYKLNPHLDIDLINVSEALSENVRVTYPRIPKPSKLDEFLDIRLKTIEAQEKAPEITEKKPSSGLLKVEVKSGSFLNQTSVKLLVKKGATASEISRAIANKLGRRDLFRPKIATLANGDISASDDSETSLKITPTTSLMRSARKCYSPLCRLENIQPKLGVQCNCYSPSCRTFRGSQLIIVRKDMSKLNILNTSQKIVGKDTSTADAISKQSNQTGIVNTEGKIIRTSPTTSQSSVTPKIEKSDSDELENADVKDPNITAQVKPVVKNAVSGKAFLGKARPTKKSKKIGKGVLPPCNRFMTPSKIKSILALPPHELRKLCRKAGFKETAGFNYNAKNNQYIWPYGTCPRPSFKTAWQFRTQTLGSIHEAALQLRVLWACIRWDDVQAKPPPSGTNTISTETEVQTIELLQRRDVGMFGLRSEYLVRRITVPIDLPTKPRGKKLFLITFVNLSKYFNFKTP